MRKIYYLLLACILTSVFVACEKDDPSQPSIFANDTKIDSTAFDRWLSKTYNPYNIRIIYRYQDYETDQKYNVIPAKMENVKALAKMMRHIWIDAYKEVVGADFIKTSTGFGTAGATVEDVALMSANTGSGVKVKAAGGIRSEEAAREMIKAGASRIGASRL